MGMDARGSADSVKVKPEATAATSLPIDPLRRVFVPIEQRTPRGTIVFKTHDNRVYARREEGGPMYRAIPKVRGKAARRHDKQQRRLMKMAETKDPREPQGERQQDNPQPPSNSNPRPAPGGVGTGTQGDPADAPDAQPGGDGNGR